MFRPKERRGMAPESTRKHGLFVQLFLCKMKGRFLIRMTANLGSRPFTMISEEAHGLRRSKGWPAWNSEGLILLFGQREMWGGRQPLLKPFTVTTVIKRTFWRLYYRGGVHRSRFA